MSSVDVTKERYRIDLITAFNNLRIYIGTFYDIFTPAAKQKYDEQFDKIEEKLVKCLNALELSHEVASNSVENIQSQVHTQTHSSLNIFNETFPPNTSNHLTQSTENILTDLEQITIRFGSTPNLNTTDFEDVFFDSVDNMEAQQKFLSLCGSQISKNYDGDPLHLAAFVNSVKLLKGVQGDNAALLLLFVKSKLIGRALEAIDNTADTVDKVIDQLEAEIKHENSKVLKGRMAAVHFNPSKSKEFAQETELLAEALQRTLILEGMTKQRAKEEAIEKTIDLCRKSTRSDLVRSILGASTFNSPQEVISKFIVENSTDKDEKQILAFRAFQNKQKTSTRGRGFYRGNNYRNSNNGNGNWRYNNNNNNNRQGRGRGRGRGRGNYRNNHNNTRGVNFLENQAAPPPGVQQVSQIAADQQ